MLTAQSVTCAYCLIYRMLAAHWEGNPNVIYCKARGSGGADEMTGALEDSEVMYGLGKLLSRLDSQIGVLFGTVNSTIQVQVCGLEKVILKDKVLLHHRIAVKDFFRF